MITNQISRVQIGYLYFFCCDSVLPCNITSSTMPSSAQSTETTLSYETRNPETFQSFLFHLDKQIRAQTQTFTDKHPISTGILVFCIIIARINVKYKIKNRD